jgi:endonuclease YncB( thermonuclease family)
MRGCVSLLRAAVAVVSHVLAVQPTLADEHSHPREASHAIEAREAFHSSEPNQAENGSLDGELLWVMDGDSLRVRIAGEQVEVRLADIDAPEHGQRYAWEAKLALIDLVRGKRLTLVPREIDRHGRMVARVWVREIDVSRELVNQGAAWFYPAYAKDGTLRDLEQQARAAKRGLWGSDGPHLAPWLWRQSHPTFQGNTPPDNEEHQLRRVSP